MRVYCLPGSSLQLLILTRAQGSDEEEKIKRDARQPQLDRPVNANARFEWSFLPSLMRLQVHSDCPFVGTMLVLAYTRKAPLKDACRASNVIMESTCRGPESYPPLSGPTPALPWQDGFLREALLGRFVQSLARWTAGMSKRRHGCRWLPLAAAGWSSRRVALGCGLMCPLHEPA
ncbi:hypothetical protein LX36DRAFT_273411 [Colletotrichum falcatum]|nr:hypothetical protein LX36DRAFT_273411 [Colletotrichum falcatum]